MWIMIIIAVHINNPTDIPGRVEIEMPSLEICQDSLKSIKSWIKFTNFKITAICQQKLS